MSTGDYRILTFHHSKNEENVSLIWVVSDEKDICYCVEVRADLTIIQREGVLADKVPVATLKSGATPTVAFGKGNPVPPHLLLLTHSKDLKMLYNGSGKYRWCAVNDGRRVWFELLNPLVPSNPFARLRVVRGESSALISLELSVDIWLHSAMCDGIIAAIILMWKTNDVWLESAGVQLS